MTSGSQRVRRSTPLLVVLLAAPFAAGPLGCSSASSPGTSDGGGGGSSGGSSGASSSGGGPGAGSVGALCSASAPCATGLTCAQSGTLLGRCTADCTTNLDLCATQFGANTLCLNASQCALICSSASDCPGSGQCVSLSSGNSACITNPNGPSGATTPPNGACTNLGGAFGDTVPNGGYRCTPTTGQGPLLTIDECRSGSWMTAAFTCTCQVTSSISGQPNPSDCSDISAPGTAQCSYAFDYCEQCDPTAGCQAH